MNSTFANDLNRSLDLVSPGIGFRLNRLESFPDAVQLGALGVLLKHACECQHIGNITAARNAFAMVPETSIAQHLDAAVRSVLDLSDEWEFRRLLELLREIKAEQLSHYVEFGHASSSEDIRQASRDYQEGLDES